MRPNTPDLSTREGELVNTLETSLSYPPIGCSLRGAHFRESIYDGRRCLVFHASEVMRGSNQIISTVRAIIYGYVMGGGTDERIGQFVRTGEDMTDVILSLGLSSRTIPSAILDIAQHRPPCPPVPLKGVYILVVGKSTNPTRGIIFVLPIPFEDAVE